MIRGYFLIILLTFCLGGISQTKFTVSGTIKDKKSGETVIGAIVKVLELKNIGTTTNEFGFFSLSIPEGDYTLITEYFGFKSQTQKIVLKSNLRLDFLLDETAKELEEVEVTATKQDDNVKDAQTGVQKIDIKEINKLPVLMGERDLVKSMQLTPGVKSGGDGNAGFYVRGGGLDQNLILLDDAPVYNASHLLGFFSTFNSDAIKDATLYKGGMPSQYGGRLASVLDIKMNEGNNRSYHAAGGIGLISSRLSIEGPIQKEKSSFLISGRRTYADLLLRSTGDERFEKSTLYFYDLNAKANYIIGSKDRIYLSGYFGRDKLGLKDLFGLDWGNATGTLRWNHIINPKWFSNTSFIFSNYSYKINVQLGGNEISLLSRIQDFNLKQEFQYFANPRNSIKIGFNAIHHTIVPGEIKASEESGLKFTPPQNRYSLEGGLYFSNNWKASQKLNIIYGLRLSSFNILGAGDFLTLNDKMEVIDTVTYKENELVKSYNNLEPRLSASYQLSASSSLKASYARMTQNLHLLSNSTSSSPTDRWIPSSNNVKPEIADQVSIGYFRNFSDDKYEFNVEMYYKDMQNQIDYKDGANVISSDVVEPELLFGDGRAYGIECFLKKRVGKLTGWVGYTLSRTEKKIQNINDNNWYPAKQDRTHDVSLVAIYELSKKWTFSATFVYYTGNAVTFPSGKYKVEEQVVFYYTERNGYRMPDYHRLDIAATWKLKERKKFSSELAFSIYNVYARENAFIINFRENENDPTKTEAVQISLFRIVPSISYNFKF